MSIITGKRVLSIEAKAIEELVSRLDSRFTKALDILYNCTGRIVVTGMGKSGLIGKKISATFASTGAPSFFLHPAEGIHGDIGMVMQDDVILAISNSGETDEIIALLPIFKRRSLKIICLTGKHDSTLSRNSDVVLDVSVKEEACPMNLVPTASTTATLAMGDALAVALFEKRGFREEDFALYHPGGALGRRLLLSVKDLMHTASDIPMVYENSNMKDVICEMTSKKLGITAIVDSNRRLTGIITDGDLRRLLEREIGMKIDIFNLKASEVMTKNPKIISPDALAVSAVQMMESYSITSLIIKNDDDTVGGIIHLHDLLKKGIV
ncbi:MAG: D-arabinose 5-phosphate isomerase [Nitrospirae bacterium GWA2_42_11]|nr:MAG: D-arabinose 5-phosphate isomerase [Nitrospirae bacterium GWA2_42_11]HAS16576.1 D-arabinose 5-phosphate isomerase [Nitrospiraceae bacterium]